MLRELINLVPFYYLVPLFVLFFATLSYCSAQLTRYFVSTPTNRKHREVFEKLVLIFVTVFSVLFVFIIIDSWQFYLQERATVSSETAALSLVIRNAAVLPPEISKKITEDTLEYVRLVRTEEWKAMHEGRRGTAAWEAFNRLYSSIQAYQPSSGRETIYYSQMILNMNELLHARRDRVILGDSIIPPELSASLIFSVFLIAIGSGVTRRERGFFNMLPATLLSAAFGFDLALAISFDFPYSGSVSVSNSPFYEGTLGKHQD